VVEWCYAQGSDQAGRGRCSGVRRGCLYRGGGGGVRNVAAVSELVGGFVGDAGGWERLVRGRR